MAQEDQKEIAEAITNIKTDAEKIESLLKKDKYDEAKKALLSDSSQLTEEVQKKNKVLEELSKKIIEGERKFADALGGGGLIKGKTDQYSSYISSNFYEFGKIRNMLESKERLRINHISDATAAPKDVKLDRKQLSTVRRTDETMRNKTGQSPLKKIEELKKTAAEAAQHDYSKPTKATVSITYIKATLAKDKSSTQKE